MPKVCSRTPQALSLAHGQLLEESGQSVADGLDCVVIVGVARRALLLEVGPLTHHASPFDVGIAHEFFQAFANRAECNLHLILHYGGNAHHVIESLFKAAGRAARAAVAIDPRQPHAVPSTKGTLDT